MGGSDPLFWGAGPPKPSRLRLGSLPPKLLQNGSHDETDIATFIVIDDEGGTVSARDICVDNDGLNVVIAFQHSATCRSSNSIHAKTVVFAARLDPKSIETLCAYRNVTSGSSHHHVVGISISAASKAARADTACGHASATATQDLRAD